VWPRWVWVLEQLEGCNCRVGQGIALGYLGDCINCTHRYVYRCI